MSVRIAAVVERTVVVNLDRRPDRLSKVRAELDRVGIPFERFAAIDGRAEPVASKWRAYAERPLARLPAGRRPVRSYREFYLDYESPQARVAFFEQQRGRKALATPGAFGLLLSMTGVVRRALGQGWESVLILEDDVLFHRETARLFERAWAQLPADWVILQLGAMQLHWEDDWIEWWSDNLYRCHGSSLGAHAVALRRPAFEPLLAACEKCDLPFDIGALHEVKRRYRERCFTIVPNLAIQDAADSEIGMSTVFFREARKTDNLYRWHLPDYGPAAARTVRDPKPSMPEPRPMPNLGDLWCRLQQKLRSLRPQPSLAASTPGPPAADTAAPPGTARAGLKPLRALARSRPGARCVLVVVVGVHDEDLETVVARLSAERATVPVFLTDDDRFEIFRRHTAVFEYLPEPAAAPDLDVDLYRLRRLALLRRKWQPAKIVAFGAQAARLIQAWRASPFEDRGIIDLTGGAAAAAHAAGPPTAGPARADVRVGSDPALRGVAPADQ